MTRLQADLWLGLAAIIWGAAFLAQKTALAHLGPFTFVSLRFALSALCVLPLALRERRRLTVRTATPRWQLPALCLAIIGGVLLQQYALTTASITNGGMLTGLYVVLVPVVLTVVFRRRQPPLIWAAAVLSIVGTWLLTTTGSVSLAMPQRGDLLLLASALSFAFQVTLIGMMLEAARQPLRLCLLQYTAVALAGGVLALLFEQVAWEVLVAGINAALPELLFAGVVSGGFAYTLQALAQQHTPSSDAAIIMGAEGMVAALCGIAFLQEPLTLRIALGCLTIIAAILLVEAGPGLRRIILRRTSN